MAARNDIHHTPPHADALATRGEGNNQTAPVGPSSPPEHDAPTNPSVEVPKKARADWTLPPHLRESFPWQPKGGRAPRPTTNTPS